MTAYEREITYRREAYIMAKRSPWHLWASLAQRAGYTPPLVPGTIPPDIPSVLPAGAGWGCLDPASSLATLNRSADGESSWLRFVRSFAGLFFILVTVISVLLIIHAVTTGDGFQVALVNRLPH
jgi:hypothetical protein